MKELRSLIADDQPSFRQQAREMIPAIPWASIIAEAKDGVEAIEMVKRHRPDVVLMDIMMPGMSGIEATQRIKEIAPQTKVIAITAYDNAEFPKRSIEAGADLFIKKEELDSETLKECLEKLSMTNDK
jgi:DNA-binding NarL/FixJ family response regulator